MIWTLFHVTRLVWHETVWSFGWNILGDVLLNGNGNDQNDQNDQNHHRFRRNVNIEECSHKRQFVMKLTVWVVATAK